MTAPHSVSARRPRRDAEHNRAVIVAAATEAIAQDPRASIDVIARRAGLTRRALYGHFDDRDALVREVIAVGAARFNEIAAGIDDADARVTLARLTATLWHEAAHIQVATSLALDDARVADTAEALVPLRQRLLEVVRDGQSAGTLRTDVTAPTLARLIEETARTVITRMDASSPDAASLAIRAVLSIAGLSWSESVALLQRHTDLVTR